MTSWQTFVDAAPRVSTIFSRRHQATGKLCLLATLRADGYPRICPIEPRVLAGELWVAGMPNTAKFRDLARDPRFCLHTATIDSAVTDGDAKIWGEVRNVADTAVHQQFADMLFDDAGIDVRGQHFDHLYAADIQGASAVEHDGSHLTVTVWKPGQPERVARRI